MTLLDSIQAPIADDLAKYNVLFADTMQHRNTLLNIALNHLAQRKGKQMRPALVFLSARLCGEVNESVFHAALALELLHTASLVHDDVVDESSRRRGQKSVNALLDNKAAVLIGDFLLSKALQHASMTNNQEVFSIISNVGQTLADGELLQLSNIDSDKFDESSYYEVIGKKTASLFAACAQFGAMLAGGSPEDIERSRQFGKLVGMCFQLRDDIFDYDTSNDIGKPAGNDMREGKLTLPVLHVVNASKDEQIVKRALDIRSGEATAEDIQFMIQYTKENGGISYAEWAMDEFRMMADGLIIEDRDPEISKSLHDYVSFVAQRNV